MYESYHLVMWRCVNVHSVARRCTFEDMYILKTEGEGKGKGVTERIGEAEDL